ncbi:hypothetical protein Pcac1_g18261 [Phytophthora cactorum]|nr:hypothetical protein Pcac1_g18261 [Phytophthora cactorum]
MGCWLQLGTSTCVLIHAVYVGDRPSSSVSECRSNQWSTPPWRDSTAVAQYVGSVGRSSGKTCVLVRESMAMFASLSASLLNCRT